MPAGLQGEIQRTKGMGGRAKYQGVINDDISFNVDGNLTGVMIFKAFIVNIGDMMERWTNCLFRSTLHRVMPTGQERYSAAFFLDPNNSCVVECLESCCSESCPPRSVQIPNGRRKVGEHSLNSPAIDWADSLDV
ncbi:hypothetical protein Pint_15822 [Pistacia integerrima]|uniref:Uncharacterized protein n=1 Tax=Pistacia integerrima TaxID=434235 RepID=A0ACC0ZBB6_9ROSI|nr:hypothetical protein Pint_15822 [Pistacia integerrima]